MTDIHPPIEPDTGSDSPRGADSRTDAAHPRTTDGAPARRVRPDGLLRRAGTPAPTAGRHGGVTARLGRRIVSEALTRMRRDHLTVVDVDGTASTFGATDPTSGALAAEVRILDDRAWWALAREGSIGLGRGYLERWWDSDDPTTVVRIIIRNIEPVDEFRNRISNATGWAGDALRRLAPRPDRHRNKEDIASHYDVGNEFFQLFLDETMTYSSAIFPSAEVALAEGSRHKYDRLLGKLAIDADHRVLEIGTGWGGFALRAVDTTGCRVTTTTVSSEQLREARLRVGRAGRDDDVILLDSDWRDLVGRFDRVVSIEMIEAVDWRDYDQYFATIERCLAPDGLVGIQAICVPDRRYERTKNTEDFIRRFVFPGGFLPSLGAINRSLARATRLQIIDVEDFSAHYAETLRQWRQRFDDRTDEVRALGLDDRFCRLWRFYLAYCEAGFLERHCTVNQIVIAGPHWRPDGLSLPRLG